MSILSRMATMFHGVQLVPGKHLNVYRISSSGLEVTSLKKRTWDPGDQNQSPFRKSLKKKKKSFLILDTALVAHDKAHLIWLLNQGLSSSTLGLDFDY